MVKKNANTELYKIRLDKGGYEYGTGRYYGVGMPLYRFTFDDGRVTFSYEFRAATRDIAKDVTSAVLKDNGLTPVFYRD